jgi:hypothetical protein
VPVRPRLRPLGARGLAAALGRRVGRSKHPVKPHKRSTRASTRSRHLDDGGFRARDPRGLRLRGSDGTTSPRAATCRALRGHGVACLDCSARGRAARCRRTPGRPPRGEGAGSSTAGTRTRLRACTGAGHFRPGATPRPRRFSPRGPDLRGSRRVCANHGRAVRNGCLPARSRRAARGSSAARSAAARLGQARMDRTARTREARPDSTARSQWPSAAAAAQSGTTPGQSGSRP